MQKAPSYVSGTSDAPLLGMTIGQALDRARVQWGEREALVSPSHGVRLTWREFADQVDALARASSRSASNAATGSASGRSIGRNGR